jgi:serine/threonine protein kinase
MSWSLLVVDGADLSRQLPLPRQGKVRVGKDVDHSHVQFNDFYLEKSHCLFEIVDEGVIVHDTSRERGVFVNGKRIVNREKLSTGDVVRVGNTHLRLEPYDGAAPEPPRDVDAHPSAPAQPLKRLIDLQGHTLGHYEVGLPLGKGHHGVVFRARDTSSGQSVALKVLSTEFPKHIDELKKFAAVIKANKPLAQHPNLVHWCGAGKVGAYVWIAQELVDGENLRATLAQPESTRSSWRGAWRLASGIGQALEHLHRRHVAHGNITEANILLNGSGTVQLNDFGFKEALAGSALQERAAERKLFAELPYTAPESLEQGAFVDPYLADIYGLGVATFVRLSGGAPPFVATEPAELIELILAGVSDRHRRRDLAAPNDFLDVIYKMLARHQEDRYQSAEALLADLERFKDRK